jgi:hypothetical protein
MPESQETCLSALQPTTSFAEKDWAIQRFDLYQHGCSHARERTGDGRDALQRRFFGVMAAFRRCAVPGKSLMCCPFLRNGVFDVAPDGGYGLSASSSRSLSFQTGEERNAS